MAYYTYRQLYTAGLEFVGLTLADVSGDADMLAKARSWPNKALDDLARFCNWPWLTVETDLDVSAGDSEVRLPTNFLALSDQIAPQLVGISDGVLHPAGRKQLQSFGAAGGTGRPRWYALAFLYAKTYVLRFGQPSDADYTLRVAYLMTLPTLVNDLDQPRVPSGYEDIVRLGTLAIAEEEQDRVPQGRMRPAYEQAKAQARARLMDPSDCRPPERWLSAGTGLAVYPYYPQDIPDP